MTRTRTIHYCNVCDYKTDRKYDRDKHVTRMHGFNVQQNESQKLYKNLFKLMMHRIMNLFTIYNMDLVLQLYPLKNIIKQ